MRYLLDSHVAIWIVSDPDRLTVQVRSTLETASEVFFSPVTPWELGIEVARGRLRIDGDLVDALVTSGFDELPIRAEHARLAASLPDHHRDPFDRMLVAQATLEGLTLVTHDRQIADYGVPVLDPLG